MNGQVLDFGVSGKLIMNALVMFDRETGTLWSHFLSQAISGPLKGTKLENVPVTLTPVGQVGRDLSGHAGAQQGFFRLERPVHGLLPGQKRRRHRRDERG